MPRLQRKSFSTPDQVRNFTLGRIDIVNLDETTIGRFVWEPGWRWSKDVAPVVRTPSCQNRHVGYVIAGHLHVVMDDGTELDIVASDAYEIPPGHDAWVVGDVPWDTVEFTSARSFGVGPRPRTSGRWRRSCSPTSSNSTATLGRLGDTALAARRSSTTTIGCARSWTGSVAARSSRPATASSRCSTERLARCDVPRR